MSTVVSLYYRYFVLLVFIEGCGRKVGIVFGLNMLVCFLLIFGVVLVLVRVGSCGVLIGSICLEVFLYILVKGCVL